MLVSPIEKIKLKTAQKYWKNEKMKQIHFVQKSQKESHFKGLKKIKSLSITLVD